MDADVPRRLVLTRLGDIANRHSVLTELGFWRQQVRDFNSLANQDIEWELACGERIAGLQELLELCHKHGLDVLKEAL